jgi:hypothetical protein
MSDSIAFFPPTLFCTDMQLCGFSRQQFYMKCSTKSVVHSGCAICGFPFVSSFVSRTIFTCLAYTRKGDYLPCKEIHICWGQRFDTSESRVRACVSISLRHLVECIVAWRLKTGIVGPEPDVRWQATVKFPLQRIA